MKHRLEVLAELTKIENEKVELEKYFAILLDRGKKLNQIPQPEEVLFCTKAENEAEKSEAIHQLNELETRFKTLVKTL